MFIRFMLYYSGYNALAKPNAESNNSNYAERGHLPNLFFTICKGKVIFQCFGFTNYVTFFTFCIKRSFYYDTMCIFVA